MNVLIISQPVLSYSNNMGKTLMAYFSAFPANNVSQFFLRQGEPTNTDVLVKLLSLFGFRRSEVYFES